jgi:prevent-host-death family protein
MVGSRPSAGSGQALGYPAGAAAAPGRPLKVLHQLLLVTIMTMIVIGAGEKSRMNAQTWTVAQAKARFSEVIDRAMSEGPQTITRNGRTAAVLVDAEEWHRKTKRVGTLADFFASSPLRGSGLKLQRSKGRLRKIDL